MSEQITFDQLIAESNKKESIWTAPPSLSEDIYQTVASYATTRYGFAPELRSVVLERLINYDSIYFLNSLIGRIYRKKTVAYVEFGSQYVGSLKTSLKLRKRKNEPDFVRFDLHNMDDVTTITEVLCVILDLIIQDLPKEYDCCSSYEQCSDAKKCINPNRVFALGCGYRKNLTEGRIFYGKNRNID